MASEAINGKIQSGEYWRGVGNRPLQQSQNTVHTWGTRSLMSINMIKLLVFVLKGTRQSMNNFHYRIEGLKKKIKSVFNNLHFE